jgi:hypothetical protein
MNKEILKRYDIFFGKDSSKKLLEEQKKQKNTLYIRINLSKNFNVKNFFLKNRIIYEETFLPNCYKIKKHIFHYLLL